jgi:ABC-type lipoprotein release transport system permease subunit
MLRKLALQTIRQKKFRTFLASTSITIGTASLILFLGLSSGIKQATFAEIEKTSPLTQITVRPNAENTGIISFIAQSEGSKLTKEDIETISKLENIVEVYPEIQFSDFASIEARLLGFVMTTDAMVFGVPTGFIENDITSANLWDRTEEPFPTLIPRRILDLYNLGIAAPRGLPKISEESLLGKELKLYPSYSTFFPGSKTKVEPLRLEVVGFSDKANLLGVTLSTQVVEKLNTDYSKTTPLITELFVVTNDPSKTTETAKKIEELGFNTEYFQKNFEEIEAKFAYLSLSMGTISLIILLTAGIAIISTFLATIAERTKELGLFRAIGATKRHIKQIILYESIIIGLIGSTSGIILGYLGSKIIDSVGLKQLEITSLAPETLFNIDLKLIIITLTFGILLSMLAAYIPAKKASNINPIEALNK